MALHHYTRVTKIKLNLSLDIAVKQISNYYQLNEKDLKDIEEDIKDQMMQHIAFVINTKGSELGSDTDIRADRAKIGIESITDLDNNRLIDSKWSI